MIAGAALNQTPIDWESNYQNIIEAIKQAQNAGVQYLCLPELSVTAYGCEDLFYHAWVWEKSLDVLAKIVPLTKGIVVNIGIPYAHEGDVYNCAVLVKDEKILGVSAKQFLANDGIHYESRWFKPWPKGKQVEVDVLGATVPLGDVVYDIDGQKLAFEICEDAWREERPGKEYAKQGVDIIFNPSASHFAFGKTLLRKSLVESSSKQFNCTYVYANLLGNEAGKVVYDGEVLIAKYGGLVACNKLLSFKNVNLVMASDKAVDYSYPGKNEEFPAAVALALFDYLRKSRTKSYVLSLSGGADSSACAVLVKEMIRRGAEELGGVLFAKMLNQHQLEGKSEKEMCADLLHTAYQGTVNSSEDTFLSAKNLADSIGAKFYSWLIDDEVNSYTSKIEKVLGRSLDWQVDDIALQNIQARSRSPIIWMLTNIAGGLLLTTSNRSEGDVGYATMDGDTSGSLAPIAGVDKQFIREWLQYAEKELGYEGLHDVNNLAPSAELRPQGSKQTDEDDLMPYPILAKIERLAVYEFKSPKEVYLSLLDSEGLDKELAKRYVNKFYRLWSINQWKRERLAPSFHLDDFNVDPRTWCRFPILSGSFTEELAEINAL